jgi:hypothetical protein
MYLQALTRYRWVYVQVFAIKTVGLRRKSKPSFHHTNIVALAYVKIAEVPVVFQPLNRSVTCLISLKLRSNNIMTLGFIPQRKIHPSLLVKMLMRFLTKLTMELGTNWPRITGHGSSVVRLFCSRLISRRAVSLAFAENVWSPMSEILLLKNDAFWRLARPSNTPFYINITSVRVRNTVFHL